MKKQLDQECDKEDQEYSSEKEGNKKEKQRMPACVIKKVLH